MLSKERGELWTKVAKADGKTMMEIRIPTNRGIAGCVASTGQPLNIADAYKDPRFDPSTDRRTGYKTRNILCMPVFNSGGDLIAVTQLINKQQGGFTASDEEFMQAFNIQAGIALENAKLFENLLLEKQYQKDILESLSDAVVSTDLEGRIVTINDAALSLLGCPIAHLHTKNSGQLWEYKLIGRYIWEVLPVDHLQLRLQDSLKYGARHYVPEQILVSGIALSQGEGYANENTKHHQEAALRPNSVQVPSPEQTYILVFPDEQDPEKYIPWNETDWDSSFTHYLTKEEVTLVERSVNLTVNPLTNPQGMVRGGLVVLEDISQEKRMKSMMYRYMTPGVAERVMALGEEALKVGERREVSILFSDIRGYTTMTENMDPTDVLSLLNKYFETMVEAVFDHEGTLDKFIGDALMAVFGAPLPLSENHAWKAVQSALDMRRRLQEFNQHQLFSGQPKINFGIGISSGDVVSGNVGSQKRMDYTVIGDTVNVSARLEAATKEYLCDIIISEHTYRLCHDRVVVRELDLLRVKGKNQALTVYELIGASKDLIDPQLEKFLYLYQLGRDAYKNRNFPKAITYFQDAQALKPHDHPVRLHLDRSQIYLETPPPEDWDGAYNASL
jgi:adenylate cyclase